MSPPSPAPNTWVNEFPYAVTVSDANGIITEMNDAAATSFQDSGGRDLIGTDLLACHPEHAQTIVKDLLATARPNIYSIEKGGKRKLIVQSPWYRQGQFAGIVELSIVLPEVIPHFNRDASGEAARPMK